MRVVSPLPSFILKQGVTRIHCYIRFEESLPERISQTSPGELDSPIENAAFCLGCKEHKPEKR